ncbi:MULTISPECIES: co-chaperone GroES [unclassified Candidatus Frackibacter]|uniref:co-chaperone GroES n=1 Tax=unclassified Candidatus Frackibacter TaxID=2648818 RepID=UPI00079C7EA8|nr:MULTISPECIES: co-chaperone GroES [unclassified Candidatus Frackibacter]KXS42209.1 MAG: chaperonin GroES [Candidatus Frackibacter sp. T328-2]SDC23836.1 chaperonin GroES [Candidatus Frackibacter sp. WG11]SEM48132.1 chaperonin GroES [Candidatus Frackibacter sp. WG12]SFL50109.1 chaperonin GroES [Candidatus Frackibacter sp. WG13]
MGIKPLGDRVVVQALEAKEETTESGIVLPDSAKEKPQEGKVVAVGEGKKLDSGERLELDVSEGDKVVYGKYAGTEIEFDGEEYLVISEKDILAIVE